MTVGTKKILKKLVCAGIVGIALLGNITADAAIVTMEKTEAVAVLNGTIVDQYDFYLTLETGEEFGMVHLIAQTPTQQAIFDPVQSTFVGGSNGGVDTGSIRLGLIVMTGWMTSL